MLVDGSEIDDSNGAEVGEIGGDKLGPRSEIPKWSAQELFKSDSFTILSDLCDRQAEELKNLQARCDLLFHAWDTRRRTERV